MMQFGWNPYPSMFQGPTSKDQTAQAVAALQQAGVDIPSAVEDIARAQESGAALGVSSGTTGGNWFYLLLGVAITAGVMHRRRA